MDPHLLAGEEGEGEVKGAGPLPDLVLPNPHSSPSVKSLPPKCTWSVRNQHLRDYVQTVSTYVISVIKNDMTAE